jgi:PucR C-terminal helix-turn-helix domain
MRSDQDQREAGKSTARPWERLDPALAAALALELPALADEVIAEIGRAIAEYRRPLRGDFGRGLRAGVERALQQFVGLVGDTEGSALVGREVYRELGRGEQRAGRGLDALQAAYRLGARLSWQRLSAVAREHGADAATVSLLAESVFDYIEEISASSVEGYAEAQAELAGERERRRRRLIRLLVEEGQPADERVLRAAALEAGWEPPAVLAVLVCPASGLGDDFEDATRLTSLIGGGALGARIGELICVLVPDPDSFARREQLGAAVVRVAHEGIRCAALGPTVAPAAAALSFARAREALRLQLEGVLPSGELLFCSEHLLALLLHRDAAIAAELLARRLAPLAELPPATRERLQRTLLAWLGHQGNIPPIAAELHIHRQTVRYRLGRLRELFGAALEDPQSRLEIELALRIAAREHAGP